MSLKILNIEPGSLIFLFNNLFAKISLNNLNLYDALWEGKLHQISPKPIFQLPSESSIINPGLDFITPKEV